MHKTIYYAILHMIKNIWKLPKCLPNRVKLNNLMMHISEYWLTWKAVDSGTPFVVYL